MFDVRNNARKVVVLVIRLIELWAAAIGPRLRFGESPEVFLELSRLPRHMQKEIVLKVVGVR